MAADGGMILAWHRAMPLEVAYMKSVSLTVFTYNMWTGLKRTVYMWQGVVDRRRVAWSPL